LKLRITILNDNTVGMGGFLAEWGLSILVESEETKVLLDTGMSNSAIHNAELLGIDLGEVSRIVLSHGHADHTGGLREVLRRMKKEIEIIAHPDVWQDKYDRREGKPEKYIGIPFRREELESLGARFRLTEGPVKITANIMTSGEIPMLNGFETVDKFIFIKENSVLRPDQVMDDQALIISTRPGLIILLGCAHRGIINTVQHAQKITGVAEVYAIVGGSHLIGTSEERLWQTIAALKELNVRKLGLCHCTDLPVISVLAREFGENFFFNKSGMVIDLLRD
jgi:7,8-dihydropterin-6-yl-methyl-4-(beta-D-ribofuranosyl)aminobenzene 5'-phosphate synthase